MWDHAGCHRAGTGFRDLQPSPAHCGDGAEIVNGFPIHRVTAAIRGRGGGLLSSTTLFWRDMPVTNVLCCFALTWRVHLRAAPCGSQEFANSNSRKRTFSTADEIRSGWVTHRYRRSLVHAKEPGILSGLLFAPGGCS